MIPDDITSHRPPIPRRRAIALMAGAPASQCSRPAPPTTAQCRHASPHRHRRHRHHHRRLQHQHHRDTASTDHDGEHRHGHVHDAGPRGDGRAVPGRRLERARHPHRARRGAQDITTSFGSFTGTAEGVPDHAHLTVLDSSNGCAPLAGGAVYLWHADKDGHYSMYTAPDANYLRGVQEADATGTVTFQSIWPGCYDGRWPHMHFEVYPTLADALEASNRIVTSQIALPQDACDVVVRRRRLRDQRQQPTPHVAGQRQRVQRRLGPGAGHRHRQQRPTAGPSTSRITV